MTNFKLSELNIPIGLCEITYGDIVLPSMGSEGTFQSIPKYKQMTGGGLNEIQGYLLEQYEVSFEVSFQHEVLEMFNFYLPTLQSYQNGYYDSPNKVNMSTNKLVIHPYGKDNNDYDICIWNAFIDPETGFKRTFAKEADKFNVRFIGRSVKTHADSNIVNSYFYIGDWSKVGAPLA
jgi:hypothetical protein